MFRRILADRDIQSEPESTQVNLAPGGEGATNVIRRLINVVGFNEDLIQTELLTALDTIFGEDGTFDRIESRLHEQDSEDEGPRWEVFLGEPRKGLVPLSKSGSGLKTVIMVLLNLLVMPEIEKEKKSNFVFAFEELENNLHPALLRRVLQYLADYVSREKCHLFLTTHSNVTLDFFSTREDSQIIHVSHNGTSAKARTIKAHFDHVGLLTELGSRPSDLLQANGVVWLEGPSDRIYLNRLIEIYSSGKLREGRDYQCAFYGGALLAKASFTDPETADPTFTNLLRLNNNIAVICDGDRVAKSGKGSRIKGRVQRIKKEVEKIPSAYLWISEAKEIENYVPGEVWETVYGLEKVPDPQQFDKFPTKGSGANTFIAKHLKRKTFDKVEFALSAASYLRKQNVENRFELDSRLGELVQVIRDWNK